MEVKAIFNSYLAKRLVQSGNRIVDLQPNKNRDNSVVFYFEVTEKFINDLQNYSKK